MSCTSPLCPMRDVVAIMISKPVVSRKVELAALPNDELGTLWAVKL